MRKLDLGPEQDGPYERQTEEARTNEYFCQVFKDDDTGRFVFIISETKDNYLLPDELYPIGNNTARIAQELFEQFGTDAGRAQVFYHQPENITGNNPEKFEEVRYYFDNNGLHEHYLNQRTERTFDQVADVIQSDDFRPLEFAQEPVLQENQQRWAPQQSLENEYTTDNEQSRSVLRDDIVNEYLENQRDIEPEF